MLPRPRVKDFNTFVQETLARAAPALSSRDLFPGPMGVRLVHSEPHEEIAHAMQREKTLKEWPRTRRIRLIERGDPG